MNVLVVGGTGVISRCIVSELVQLGHEVTVFNRGENNSVLDRTVHVIKGDRSRRSDFEERFQDSSFDVVVDMISFGKDDAARTLEVFRGSKQIIFCSSVAAYKRPLKSIPTVESAETLFDDPAFGYSYNKAQMERYLMTQMQSHESAITIIRPSLTFGVGGTNLGILRQNYNVVHRIRQGRPLVMFGDGTNPWNFSFAPDVAKAFAGAVGNTNTFGQCYHATNETLYRWDDLYLEFAKLLGKNVDIVHLPTDALFKLDPALFGHLHYEKMYPGVFDNTKLKKDVPYFDARLDLPQGLQMMLEWFETSGSVVDNEKDRLEDALVALVNDYHL